MDFDLLLSIIVGRMDLNEYSATRSNATSSSILASSEWPNFFDALPDVDDDSDFRHRFAVSINHQISSCSSATSDGEMCRISRGRRPDPQLPGDERRTMTVASKTPDEFAPSPSSPGKECPPGGSYRIFSSSDHSPGAKRCLLNFLTRSRDCERRDHPASALLRSRTIVPPHPPFGRYRDLFRCRFFL
jgi:hypothetical protein